MRCFSVAQQQQHRSSSTAAVVAARRRRRVAVLVPAPRVKPERQMKKMEHRSGTFLRTLHITSTRMHCDQHCGSQCMRVLVICRVRKKVPLRCSMFFIRRSGLTRGAGTKTATRRRRHHCCCAAAAVLLSNTALPLQAFQHVKCLRVTRS